MAEGISGSDKKVFFGIGWDAPLFFYIIIGALFCHLLPLPQMVKGVLAMPSILLIPYLTGNIFLRRNFFMADAGPFGHKNTPRDELFFSFLVHGGSLYSLVRCFTVCPISV
jgi:hypothetical protein